MSYKKTLSDKKDQFTKISERIRKTFGRINDSAIRYDLQRGMCLSKINYGFNLLYATDARTRSSINTTWRKSICSGYELPARSETKRLTRATLQPKPAYSAIKTWTALRRKAYARGDPIPESAV